MPTFIYQAQTAAGQPLNDADRQKIRLHLERDAEEVEKAMGKPRPKATARARSAGE